jgi:3-deoxy-D-manno-octulosonic-acid transferase
VVRVREAVPALRVVVAPHEPHPARVTQILERLRGDGWTAERFTTVLKGHTLGKANAVVVDSVGFLADLYTIGSVALIGGANDSTGLHSVLEPAAAGLPVCFGPKHTASRAASDLIAVGGAKSATTEAELATLLVEWLTDSEGLTQAGDAARAYVADHRGAAGRSAEHLSGLLKSPMVGP